MVDLRGAVSGARPVLLEASGKVTLRTARAIAQTGVDPVALTEYAVIFSIPVLPLTYLPILLTGNDRQIMGKHVNGPVSRTLGWFYFCLICVLAVAAPVLFMVTNGGG